jgi:hypothetical protein
MEAALFGGFCAILASTATVLVMSALVARQLRRLYQDGFADGRVAGNVEAGRFRDDKAKTPADVPAWYMMDPWPGWLEKRRGQK